ncbi:ankyrin repeat protein, partial [Colletotrichum incanum]
LEGHMFLLPGFVHRSPELQEEVKTGVIQLIFLLAQLHQDSLVSKRLAKAVRNVLKKLPRDSEAYDHAYRDAIERIKGQHALTVEVGEFELDGENLPQVEDMVSACAGPSHSRRSEEHHPFSPPHDARRAQKDWFPNAQTDIMEICVTYLFFSLFESGFCRADNEFEEQMESNLLHDYAAHNWGYHAREALTYAQMSKTF